MWLLENIKGLVWLTFYFHWTAVLIDLKKVPNLTIIYSFPGGDVEVEAGIQAKVGRWGLVEGPTRGRGPGTAQPHRESGNTARVGIPQDGLRWRDLRA